MLRTIKKWLTLMQSLDFIRFVGLINPDAIVCDPRTCCR